MHAVSPHTSTARARLDRPRTYLSPPPRPTQLHAIRRWHRSHADRRTTYRHTPRPRAPPRGRPRAHLLPTAPRAATRDTTVPHAARGSTHDVSPHAAPSRAHLAAGHAHTRRTRAACANPAGHAEPPQSMIPPPSHARCRSCGRRTVATDATWRGPPEWGAGAEAGCRS